MYTGKPNLSRGLWGALKGLRENRETVVSKADKGDVCIIMDTKHYTDLAWTHLGDKNTYCRLIRDPTPDLIYEFNTYLQQCLHVIL